MENTCPPPASITNNKPNSADVFTFFSHFSFSFFLIRTRCSYSLPDWTAVGWLDELIHIQLKLLYLNFYFIQMLLFCFVFFFSFRKYHFKFLECSFCDIVFVYVFGLEQDWGQLTTTVGDLLHAVQFVLFLYCH